MPSIQARRDRATLNAPSSQITLALTQRPDFASSLPGDWDQPGWSVTRGLISGSGDSSIPFRLGVRAVDVQVALAVGDTVRANRLITEILATLERVELSDAARAEYSGLQRQLTSPLTPRSQLMATAARSEEQLEGSYWFGFGRWVRGAELAAATRSKEFFDDARTMRFLKHSAGRQELAPDDVETLRYIAVLAEQGISDNDFKNIHDRLRALIRRHGG